MTEPIPKETPPGPDRFRSIGDLAKDALRRLEEFHKANGLPPLKRPPERPDGL